MRISCISKSQFLSPTYRLQISNVTRRQNKPSVYNHFVNLHTSPTHSIYYSFIFWWHKKQNNLFARLVDECSRWFFAKKGFSGVPSRQKTSNHWSCKIWIAHNDVLDSCYLSRLMQMSRFSGFWWCVTIN